MNLFRNFKRKRLVTFLWILDVKKLVVHLRTKERHNWILKKQNAEVKGLPGCSQYNEANKIQALPWMCRTELWPSEKGSCQTPCLDPCSLSSHLEQQEEEEGCSELKSRPFYPCLAWPPGMAASWRAVLQQKPLPVWELPLEQLLCLLGTAAVGVSIALSSVSQHSLASFWQQPGALITLLDGCSNVGRQHSCVLFYTVFPSMALVLERELRCQGLCMVFFGL